MKNPITPGRIILFLSFGAMFLALLSKTASHGAKAFAVILCFSIMVGGIVLDSRFSEKNIESGEDLDFQYG